MKAKEMMKKIMMIAAVATSATLPVLAETLCSGESAEVKLDLATGTVRTPAATETLTYSTEWDGGDAVTLAVNGETLASGLAGSGTYDWTPSGSGLFTLTHTTTTGSGDVVLTAAFMIPPNYVAPVYVGGVAANGIDHWVTNAVPSGFAVVESSAARVTWGTAGATSWYVVTNGTYQIDGGVKCAGNVHLVLCDGAKLTVTNVANSCAGIATDASGSFTIYETVPVDATFSSRQIGILDVTSGGFAAGIGGNFRDEGANITINGGIVTARSGESDESGAGIGGGSFADGSNITINGGTVTAMSGDLGAGIGGGYDSDGLGITINGGTVTATGGTFSAGIGGGGEGGDGELITINGGTVKATGGEGAAGIGGGSQSGASNITIKGGVVTAIGGLTSPGIGGGGEGACENVRIANAVVFVGTVDAIVDEGEGPCRYSSGLVGGGAGAGESSSGVVIDESAQVFFNLTGLWDYNNEVWIEEAAPMPDNFEGFVIMTPETQTLDRVLVGGVANWTAATTFALTNAVTGATGEITVNGEDVIFANKLLSLPHEDSKLTLTASPIPPVAQIVTGDVTNTFTTIAAAFAAAQNGDTITMIDDATFTFTNSTYVSVVEGREITFDLNGKRIVSGTTYDGSSYLIYNKGNLTITDSAGKASDGYSVGCIYHGANPTWIYDGSGSYAGSYNSTIIANGGSGTLTLNGGWLEMVSTGSAAYALENHSSGTPMGAKLQIFINGAEVVSKVNAIRLYEASANNGTSELTMNSGYIQGGYAGILIQAPSGASVTPPNCNLTINGGTIYGKSYAFYDYTFGQLLTGNNYYLNGGICYKSIYSYGSNVHVNGGRYYAIMSKKDAYGINDIEIADGFFDAYVIIYPYLAASDIKVITGGLYAYAQLGTWLLSNYVEDGYVVCDNKDKKTAEDYPYIVKNAVASIDAGTVTNYYGWLEEAFYYVSTNQIIEVLQDNAEDIYVDKDFTFTVDSNGHKLTGKVEVRDGYEFVDNGDGTCTYRIKTIDEVPCAKADETVVAEGEKPEETKEEVWEEATNLVATVTTADAPVIVADSELTNTVEQAKQEFEVGNTNVTKVLAFVDIVVTPTGAEADADDKVRTVTMDVTPYLTTWAEVTDGETFATNQVAATTNEFEYSGKSMSISFDVSNLAAEPMLVIHRHGEEELRYTRGTAATDTTFAYDSENEEITLLMSNFSEVEIHSDIQVGANAWATVGKDGTCTITGTGAMWNANEWPESKNPLISYKKLIRSVAVEDGVTSVGSKAFHKFYALTNVTCAASVANVGTLAFYNCLSIEKLSFGTKPTLGDETLFFHSAIYMKDGAPTVEMIPEIEIGGYTKVLKGSNDLKLWDTVTDETKGNYHFFKFVMEPVPNGE